MASDAYSDYAELEIAHNDGQSGSEIPDIDFLNDELPGVLKSKSFRAKIESSKSSRSAVMPFLASVNIDLKRKKPIGLFELFSVWLESGSKYWLNPMDKEKGLGVLEEILFKFQGDVQILSPFIKILTDVAKNRISPRSFVEYVMLPRMYQDNNWRKWQESHLEALGIIANLINSIKEKPPFNKEHLGSGKTRLARDVVLVRYIGRPLAQFQLVQLRDSTMLDNYISEWQKISLQDPLCLYFMRNNALHFLYAMSGKIDLIQLIAIIEQLPAIERAFTDFPKVHRLENIKSMNLYDYDIENALLARRQRGFHSLDFTIEIKAYFNIVKALLKKPTGVYLCAHYAGLLKRYKDPDIAENISRLVRIVNDRGGMHIYKWHTKKLLAKNKNDMQSYLDHIEENNGCDPEYPRVDLIFRDEELERENLGIADAIAQFNLGRYFDGKGKHLVSYKQLISAYIKEHPDSESLITDFQNQLLAGLDRQWTSEHLRQLDSLSTPDKNLHLPLLRSIIRGIGSIYCPPNKSSGFTELFDKYSGAHSLLNINARTNFVMPVKELYSGSTDQDTVARENINLVSVEKVWDSLCNSDPVNINNTLSYINKWNMELDKPLEKAFDEKISLETFLKEAAEEETIKKTERDIQKQDKTISALRQKKQQYTVIMDDFNSLIDEQKFILSLILAGTAGRNDSEYSGFVCRLFLQRYKELDIIAARLNFLRDDISVDVLSYKQFVYILNLLETLFFALSEDKNIVDLLEDDTVLQNLLEPYLITKKKQITLDALDAAAKRMTDYASMQAERAKWQGILDKMEQKDEKYFHNMEIYTSKTFMDSYYGDMGGICLSGHPQQILRPGFFVQRLVDNTEKQIIGMSILHLSNGGYSSSESKAKNFWQAFAFNPLYSILSHYSQEQQLFLYLQFRMNMEKTAWMTKLPVVISGIDTSFGLISNNGYFGNLIRKYEYSKKTAISISNARGLSVYYSEEQFAHALVIIDPRGYEKASDPCEIPTFYAHRELQDIRI
ncbi:MAG: hypothetical protein LBQ89_03745 [Treponema sp.]|jgi:hypothetical protein|nr:hypothetical protein [Treponema sp.]